MKLRNKLLPLVGLSSAVAIAAPLAFTSCGSALVVTDIVNYDMSTAKQSTRTETFTTKNAAAEYYKNEMVKDPSVFTDDLKCWQKNLYNNAALVEYCTINYWKIGCPQNISIGSVDFWVAGTNYVFPTFSFDLTIEKDIKYKMDDSTSQIVHNMRHQIKFTCSYKNVPFTVRNDEVGKAEKWNVSALIADADDYGKMMYIPNWSYYFKSETIQTDEYNNIDEGTTESITTNIDREVYISNFSQFVTLYEDFIEDNPGKSYADFIEYFGIVDFYSNYLEKVPHSA